MYSLTQERTKNILKLTEFSLAQAVRLSLVSWHRSLCCKLNIVIQNLISTWVSSSQQWQRDTTVLYHLVNDWLHCWWCWTLLEEVENTYNWSAQEILVNRGRLRQSVDLYLLLTWHREHLSRKIFTHLRGKYFGKLDAEYWTVDEVETLRDCITPRSQYSNVYLTAASEAEEERCGVLCKIVCLNI